MERSHSFKLKEEPVTLDRVFNWLLIVGMLVAVYFGASYFSGPKWSLFYYPDGCLGCQDQWIIEINQYESDIACRDAGYALGLASGNLFDTFECGYKCKVYDDAGYLCKETVDF